MSKIEALKEIHERWIKDCPSKLRAVATQPVPGHGNADSKIVFIGEAPGRDEDLQGKPFVGAAGKLLNELLKENGFKREEVYITNVVKFRPPGNRDPEPQEIADCLPWLIEELNCIQPKLIIPLGRHALNRFFPLVKISEVHGKLLHKVKKTEAAKQGNLFTPPITKKKSETLEDLTTEYFFPLYHPAAALYRGHMREALIEDFKKLPKVLEKI